MLSDPEIVTLLVGHTKQAMAVHKAVLDLHSDLLRSQYIKPEVAATADQVTSRSETGNTKIVKTENNEERAEAQVMELDVHQVDTDSAVSTYFDRTLSDSQTMIGQPNVLMNVMPSQFAFFATWLYQGIVTPSIKNAGIPNHESWELLYQIGHCLKSPSFQNYCMDELRTSDAVRSGQWPNPAQVKTIYRFTPPGSLLRTFVVDCLACNHPFAPSKQGTDLHKEWMKLIDGITELRCHFMVASGRSWSRDKPWDEQLRNRYVIKLPGLNQRWTQIFVGEGRDGKVIAEDAREGCFVSRLQLQALKGKGRY